MRFGDIENKQEIPMLWGLKKKKKGFGIRMELETNKMGELPPKF